VVNHRAQAPYDPNGLYSVVEVFDYSPSKPTELVHVKTIQDKLIWTPNNVAPMSETSFYVSNDHTNRAGDGRSLEEYGQLPISWITYCDFKSGTVSCKKAADNLRGANGMNTDNDNYVVVNEAMGGDLVVYSVKKDNTLSLFKRVNLDYVPDNVSFDPDAKALLSTGHPKAFDFQAYAAGAAPIAPSWVDVIQADGTTKRIWSDDGNLLSGSTVFEVDSKANVALAAGVFDQRGNVRCEIPKEYFKAPSKKQ
jgi:hypothetical protein